MRFFYLIFVLSIFLVAEATSAREGSDALPKIIQHAEPIYPPIARTAHITGEVSVKITTDGESVREVEAETGPPLLRKASEDNARTWKFAPHTPNTFHVTFRYRISSGGVDVEFLKSPGIVELEAPAPVISIYYADIGLGTWEARLKSAHGKTSLGLKLAYSGPDGDWLYVSPVGKEDDEEADFGHREGDFLAFVLKVDQPDRKQLKTFLIGKMKANKIVGTFVDDAGVTGEWIAVKTAD
jgi:hypothetical protein